MASFDIVKYGSKVLRSKSERVEDFSEDLTALCDQMVETMIVEGGVGLAAPQVGVSRQVSIINPEPENERTLIRMINPRIIAASDERETMDEGCLSIPGITGEVVRHRVVDVAYQDVHGREHTLHAEGLLARIIQHEVDHLNGMLFIDRLSFAKRAMLQGKLRNLKKKNQRES